MVCPECGIEMRVVGAVDRPEKEGEVVRFVHVNRLACRNTRCGKHGAVREMKHVLWEGGVDAMEPPPEEAGEEVEAEVEPMKVAPLQDVKGEEAGMAAPRRTPKM